MAPVFLSLLCVACADTASPGEAADPTEGQTEVAPTEDTTAPEPANDTADIVLASSPPPSGRVYKRLSNPTRTAVYSSKGVWQATFTNGARTVRLRGPSRTFAEPATTTATVTTNNWVRLLDTPFTGAIDSEWLDTMLAERSPDILAIAMQYTTGSQMVMSGTMTLSGDANYGPLVNGLRQEGSDFHDFLGISWKFPTGYVVAADPANYRSLDCSGYQRMVWGYRGGIELVLNPRTDGTALPRKSADIYAYGPGVIVIPNTPGVQVTDFSKLATGDLVFQDAQTDDGTAVDHSGMFLGVDNEGHYRFLNSRKTANGPTMGDLGGKSILDGTTATFAKTFRATRRL